MSTDPLPYTSPRGILPPMIKWIPRAARKHCATLLTKLLMGVVNKPNEAGEWDKLLAFGQFILHRPMRGGARRNLTNIIARRCSDFTTDPNKVELPSIGRNRLVVKSGRKNGEINSLARAVTVRLEEGNFRGAVRLITSDDELTAASFEVLQTLREKHPTAPLDRRGEFDGVTPQH